jgi:hypothetical protein
LKSSRSAFNNLTFGAIEPFRAFRSTQGVRNIAAAFLVRDASQLEYYEQITKDMPGKVLGKHGIVQRDGDEYRLTIEQSSLSPEERDELVSLCDEAISAYLQKTRDGCLRPPQSRFGLPLGKPALRSLETGWVPL